MNTRKFLFLFVFAIAVILAGSSATRASYWANSCPMSSELVSTWFTIYPSDRLCQTDYYTWNTTGSEESHWKSQPVDLICGYRPWSNPGYTQVRVYIPSPDSKQTSNARYYRWGLNSGNYVMIGIVNQYGSTGWKYLNTVSWGLGDKLKLTDVTVNEAKYSKHVDLDAYGLTCNN